MNDKRTETSKNFVLFSNLKTSTIKSTKYFLTNRLGKSFIFTNLKVQMSLETQNAIINEAKSDLHATKLFHFHEFKSQNPLEFQLSLAISSIKVLKNQPLSFNSF